MKTSHTKKVATALATLALVAAGAMLLSHKVSAAGEGSITGSVKLTGTPPHMKGIDMSKDPYCVKQHEGNPVKMENVVIGSGGGLANVVLYISEGLSGAAATATPSEEPTFDQKGCMYTPHVMAMDVNQKYKVTTGDQTTHNIHPLPAPGSGNIGWNKSQPPGAPPMKKRGRARERIGGRSNTHPGMPGWQGVEKAPYAIPGKKENN